MMKKRMILLSTIIILIFVASLAAVFLMQRQKKEGLYAQIYRDNELITSIDLMAVTESYTLTFDYGENDYNIVEVRPGEIGIIEASCPDLLCQGMGFIHNSLMPITCLPNHLVIRVYSDGNETDTYEGMSY